MQDPVSSLGQGVRAVLLALLPLLLLAAPPAVADTDGPRAIVSAEGDGRGLTRQGFRLTLGLNAPVRFRAFTLEAPRRLVVDLEEVAFDALDADLAEDLPGVRSLRFGLFAPGWSRIVLDLEAPLTIASAHEDTTRDRPRIVITAERVSAVRFAAAARAPGDVTWATPVPAPAAAGEATLTTVVIDPGHGGIDPGAIRDGLAEKAVALTFAEELRRRLEATGRYHVALTRASDVYVGLRRRVEIARAAGADVFLSIHANTVTAGVASGAAVYTLSTEASDAEAAALAARENRADLLAGIDLAGEEDLLARVLLDMAQRETNARSLRLARAVVAGLRDEVGVIRSRPHRSAGFRVLKAPDIPSLLIELGFLSHPDDRENMRSPEWRARAADGIVAALDAWQAEEAEQAALTHP
ncbi:MAG: N-acetylmuramoyl-L-alanine amidase [Pseudomonadota bacterium]